MNDNSKLFVFSIKEVALIIFFNIVVAIAFFMLGIKLGKEHSFKEAGYTIEDKQTIDLLSSQEETVKEIPDNQKKRLIQRKSIDDQLKQHIENELNKTEGKSNQEIDAENKNEQNQTQNENEKIKAQQLSQKADVDNTLSPEKDLFPVQQTEVIKKEKFLNKYTIQLGSFRTMKEAKQFAKGFLNRGYEPIITEAHPANRGTWFRVSIGIFNSIADLKDYVNKEQHFFRSHNYFIKKIGD